jgi:hypothetical protein
MSACPVCSAPSVPDALVCEYCGTTLRSLVSAAEELEALEALSRSAQRMAAESGGGGLATAYFSQLGLAKGANQKVAEFWKNAFIPATLPGLERATLLAMSQLQTDAWKAMWHPGTKAANGAALARLNALGAALRIEVASGREGNARARAVLGEADAARERLAAAKRKGMIQYAALVGGSLVFLAIMSGLVLGAN